MNIHSEKSDFLLKFELGAVQKSVNLVDLVKSFNTSFLIVLTNFGFDTAENEPLRVWR